MRVFDEMYTYIHILPIEFIDNSKNKKENNYSKNQQNCKYVICGPWWRPFLFFSPVIPTSPNCFIHRWLKLVIPWRIARARPFWAGLWLLIRARQRWNPIGMAFLVRWWPPSCLGPSIHVLDFQLFNGKNWLLVLHMCVNLGVGYSVGSIFCRLMWISTDHCLWSNFGHVLECSRRCLGIK